MNILTFNDFYRMRFGRPAEVISALLIVPSYFSWIAAQLIALAIILQVVTGIPVLLGIIISTVVVLFYTYIGGMWAVSVTDAVQTVIILGGMLYMVLLLVGEVGGWKTVIESTPPGFFRFLPPRDLESVTNYIAAWMTLGLGSIPGQDIFQRVMAARNERMAVQASHLSGLMYLTVAFMPLIIGLCGKILYPELAEGDPQLMIPHMVLQHGTILVQILFFGALLSAILSTTSGAILAPATIIGENLVRPLLRQADDARLLRVMRLSVVGVSVCSAGIAAMEGNIYDLVSYSSAFTLVSLFVPLTAGLYWKRASGAGALTSIILGMAAWIWCQVIETAVPPSLYGFLVSLFAMIGGSLLVPDKAVPELAEDKLVE